MIGSRPMSPDEMSDAAVLRLVIECDEESFRAGTSIRQRQWDVPERAMKRLGYLGYMLFGPGTPPVLERIRAAFSAMYRPEDLAGGGHIGVFMLRDVFARISVPHGYGEVSITPLDWVELTPIQKHILSADQEALGVFYDQFADVFDLEYGSGELRPEIADNELVRRFAHLARLHLHAAAAVMTGGYDYRGAVQSALLATELSLKAGVASCGIAEDEIIAFGHKVVKLADHLKGEWPSFDAPRVSAVIARQPRYVLNRYSADQPSRVYAGHIVMGAQYVAAEVMRRLSTRDFRGDSGNPWPRAYPSLR